MYDAFPGVLAEMLDQTGHLQMDDDCIAIRGLLVRHLVLPGCAEDSARIFDWIARELSPDSCLNVMDQYHPAGAVAEGGSFPELARRLEPGEYERALGLARDAGLHRLEGK